MTTLSDSYDPVEIAHQHITLLMLACFAHTAPEPARWLEAFRQRLHTSIDGWAPDDLDDRQAAIARREIALAADGFLDRLSLAAPLPPPSREGD